MIFKTGITISNLTSEQWLFKRSEYIRNKGSFIFFLIFPNIVI